MYEANFGLDRRPFSSVPRTDQYYPATTIELSRQTLDRAVQRAEGIGLVVGAAGTGKTLLCQMLAEQFRETFRVALLWSGRLSTRRALLQAILFELGQPYRGMDEGELRLAVVDYATTHEECPNGVVLVVDEAHTLPLRLFEEIRLLTNLAKDNLPRIRLLLVGGPLLEERFANPKLEFLSQRIVARCYLEPLSRAETQQYVERQVSQAGAGQEPIFSTEACRAVHQATDGVPRLVNQLCDHAMLLAFSDGHNRINAKCVEEAWSDLQQLPTPYTSAEQAETETVIEFGGLDDEPYEPTLPTPTDSCEDDPELSAPALRVAPLTDEPADDSFGQLSVAADISDEDFHPAGSIGPELELVFDDGADPFGESFEEEEVLPDGCRMGAEPALSTAEMPGLEESEGVGEEPIKPVELLEPVSETHDRSAGLPNREINVAAESEPEPLVLHLEEDESFERPEEDSDLIVVEEGYDSPSEKVSDTIPVVRHQEFAQLFSRLRRTS
jgi:type II secretory pathway predicted ATPase ExeA